MAKSYQEFKNMVLNNIRSIIFSTLSTKSTSLFIFLTDYLFYLLFKKLML